MENSELPNNYNRTFDKIVVMIESAKHKVYEVANYETVYLFVRPAKGVVSGGWKSHMKRR